MGAVMNQDKLKAVVSELAKDIKTEQDLSDLTSQLITLFDYPDEIRRVIYTTNAIESLNSVIRKVINKRKLFPHDDSAIKIVYLAINEASKKWTMPVQNWKAALNRFMIEFEDCLINHF